MAYLDHAATTPMRPSALEAWNTAARHVGNPSSLHAAGRDARRLVEEAREQVAEVLGVAPSSVVFTSGATEADNLAIHGLYRARNAVDPLRRTIISSAIEHKAVLAPIEVLVAQGAHAVAVAPAADGVLDLELFAEELRCGDGDVALVAVMATNNETGAVQPHREVAELCAREGVPLHVDAVQSLGSVDLDLTGVSTAAFSAHKVGGPMGVGVLVVAPGVVVQPLQVGGGHENGLRAGTLNVPGIVSAAAAFSEVVAERDQHRAHLRALTDRLRAGIDAADAGAVFVSTVHGHPGILNVAFPGCESDALMMLLDAGGVWVSTGSACTVGIPQPSHVLRAMGADEAAARSALRFSVGWSSTAGDVDDALAALPDAVARARRAGLVAAPEVSR